MTRARGVVDRFLVYLGSRMLQAAAGGNTIGHPADLLALLQHSNISHAGVAINEETAMRISAVNACVRIISESIGALPVHIHKRLPNGGKERAVKHPLYRLISRAPNTRNTTIEYYSGCGTNLTLRGNHYAWRNQVKGKLLELLPLHPDRVDPVLIRPWELAYDVYPDATGRILGRPASSPKRMYQDEIFHIPGLSTNGLIGRSVISDAREGMGLAQAQEQHGANLYGRGVKASGFLKHPKAIGDKTRESLERSFNDSYAGIDNSGKCIVLEEGMDWVASSMDSDDAQYLESRKFQIADISRFFGVPLHKLAELDKATFSNIEHQGQEFLTDALLAWIRRIELRMDRDLLKDSEEYFVQFLIDGILRADIKTRYEAYGSAIEHKWLTRNEVRVMENKNPVSGGDVFENPTITPAAGKSTEEK